MWRLEKRSAPPPAPPALSRSKREQVYGLCNTRGVHPRCWGDGMEYDLVRDRERVKESKGRRHIYDDMIEATGP